MKKEQTKARGSMLPFILTPFLLLLLTAGTLILAYSVMPSHQLQKYLNIAFMDNLKTTDPSAGLNIIENEIKTETDGETFEEGEIQYPTFGEQYAQLSAESIGLTVGVYYGVSPELLDRGACQPTSSAIIGDHGNTVIDAHVNTFFSELSELQTGDEIVLYTHYGTFTYRVTEQITFQKDDKRYIAVTEADWLTLYTCQPQVLGSSDIRIGVRCEPVRRDFYHAAE